MTLHQQAQTTAAILAGCQCESAQCWEMAIDTADSPDRRAAFITLADECDAAYDLAIESFESLDVAACRAHLVAARAAELSGGDDQHSVRALAALDHQVR